MIRRRGAEEKSYELAPASLASLTIRVMTLNPRGGF